MLRAAAQTGTRELLPNGVEIMLNGWRAESEDRDRRGCVLLLTGTSTRLEDISFFTDYLAQQGHAVAALERFIGGPLDLRYDPIKEREETLRCALRYLLESRRVGRLHIVAHSYACFEIIRLLIAESGNYSCCIANLVLVNPAGFGNKKRFVRHCLRFLFLAMLREYGQVGGRLIFQSGKDARTREFLQRKCRGTATFFLRTVINPARTFKEVADLVSFKVQPHLEHLIRNERYRVHLFLNTDDNLVAPQETLRGLQDLLPPGSLLACRGHHMDLFYDADQMQLFNSFLTEITERPC